MPRPALRKSSLEEAAFPPRPEAAAGGPRAGVSPAEGLESDRGPGVGTASCSSQGRGSHRVVWPSARPGPRPPHCGSRVPFPCRLPAEEAGSRPGKKWTDALSWGLQSHVTPVRGGPLGYKAPLFTLVSRIFLSSIDDQPEISFLL